MISLAQVREAGGYSVVYADPPWSYADRGCNGAAEEHYSTMSPEAIRAMPIGQLVASDAALFLWATYPKIEEALELIKAWGFTYKSIAFQWVKYKGAKPFFGLGRWTRGNTEPCLLAVRGKPQRVSKGVSQLLIESSDDGEGCILEAPLGRHSAKPAETRDRIVRLMGDVPRIELFGRERVVGWDAWGDQVPGGSDVKI